MMKINFNASSRSLHQPSIPYLAITTTMASEITRKYPRCIATISAGFEKGDFLVREEKGQRVYFDFFEEAFNYIAAKGYSRMPKGEEGEWMELMVRMVLLCCLQ